MPRFVSVATRYHVKFAQRASGVVAKPPPDAIRVKAMLAGQLHHSITWVIVHEAYRAHATTALLLSFLAPLHACGALWLRNRRVCDHRESRD
jgi:hypothetical protein